MRRRNLHHLSGHYPELQFGNHISFFAGHLRSSAWIVHEWRIYPHVRATFQQNRSGAALYHVSWNGAFTYGFRDC